MSTTEKGHADDLEVMIEQTSRPASRRSVVNALATASLSRRAVAVSAALFAGMAARGTAVAGAHTGQGSPACCNLAKPNLWCAPGPGSSFTCDHGAGSQTSWYCCDGNFVWMCGECNNTGNCFNGPWTCSYAKLINNDCF